MWNLAQANIDMIEANNLFEVSMGKVVDEYGNLDESASEYYIKAMKFQDEMNEKLATNKAELKQYQAMYYSMLKSQGINKDASYFMSENLTKAGYDIASLYNLSVEDAMNKLKSGLSGQVESLRKIGIDVSESALSKVLDEVGIERSVQQLSYAEKEIARYIAIVEQAGQAQGEFAKTFEQPANQLRVLKNQFIELKQVAGAFIVNAFGGVLVWLNAIIMAIKEILKAFASLFGWDLESGGADLSESLGIDDISSGLGNATKKAKEFKKQIMGFDEINNINKPTTSSGGVNGSATGIDNKLLKSLKEWDNKMSSISGKAQEIRDKMLEWLGFERDDKGGWKLKEGYTNFEKIKDAISLIGSILLGWKISSGVVSFFDKLDMISDKPKALKIALGLDLVISGVAFYTKGMKKISEGEYGEGLWNSFGASLTTGIGAKLLGLSLSSSVWLTVGLAGISLVYAGNKMYKESVQSVLVEKFIPTALKQEIEFLLSVGNVVWYGLEKILPEETMKKLIKKMILNIASWVEKIPIIGTNIANAIRAGVSASENDVSNTIKYTSEEAMKKANPWIKEKSEILGRDTMTAYTSGINANVENVRTSMSTTTTKGIEGSSSTISESARTLAYKTNTTFFTNIDSTSAGQKAVNTLRIGTEDKLANKNLENRLKNIATTSNSTLSSKISGESAGKKAISSLESGTRDKTVSKKLDSRLSTVSSDVKTKLSERTNTQSVGKNIISGINTGMKNSTGSNASIWTTIGNIASSILKKFTSKLGINSPSRVMRDYVGKFIPQGIAVGIDKEAGTVYKSIEKLNEGIKVSAKDMEIDTTQNINYGAISGNIRTQISATINNNLIDGIINAVKQGMSEADVNVNIEAKTDEGVIVKKASEGFKEYVMQTGELPFPVPV